VTNPIYIDGSQGEGGGQILRSSLSLAALTGTPVRIGRIRAGRAKPGLLRQHLTCVRAIAEITGAEVRGAALGSRDLTVVPGPVRAGDYRFAVGSAGSAGLVFQTVLWPLLRADGRSRVVFEGGTHNPWSPPFDFLDLCFLPLLRRMGVRIEARLERHGFYPAGGGRFVVDLEPAAELAPLELLDAGPITGKRASAVVAHLPKSIGDRELRVARKRLGIAGDVVETTSSPGPGNVFFIVIERAEITEVITGFGDKGVKAEVVARRAVKETAGYLASGAPVGEHLADQLIIPLALAGGGAFRTAGLSMHTRTNIDVISNFVSTTVETDESPDDGTTIVRFR
jgi:RNA 3'-terminal phosphate cyclase (ATP)